MVDFLDTECHGVRLYDSNLTLARGLPRQLGRIPRFCPVCP